MKRYVVVNTSVLLQSVARLRRTSLSLQHACLGMVSTSVRPYVILFSPSIPPRQRSLGRVHHHGGELLAVVEGAHTHARDEGHNDLHPHDDWTTSGDRTRKSAWRGAATGNAAIVAGQTRTVGDDVGEECKSNTFVCATTIHPSIQWWHTRLWCCAVSLPAGVAARRQADS